METAEEVANIVEDVAEEVEKVADELENRLPGGGALQQTAAFVEELAKGTVHNANLVEDVLEKVSIILLT